MNKNNKLYLTTISIIAGTALGAGILGLPYVGAQVGFFTLLSYILLLGGLVLLINLYLGEITLRTKGNHQLPGYTQFYLGKFAKNLLQFAMVFGVYSAIIAYLLGIGKSLSFLIFKNYGQTLLLGLLFGVLMSYLLWKGLADLKEFEIIGVLLIFGAVLFISLFFAKNIQMSNLLLFNFKKILLPFGVVLFSLTSYNAIPEIRLVLKNKEKLLKKSIIYGMLASLIIYILFSLVVIGAKGLKTPQIATISLGGIFIFLGILTMFTSYLSLGNSLLENFSFDLKLNKKTSWILTSIVPMFLFVILSYFNFSSFIGILSIGGVISGGIIYSLILLTIKKAKKEGKRKPEYSIPINWFVVIILIILFSLGVLTIFL